MMPLRFSTPVTLFQTAGKVARPLLTSPQSFSCRCGMLATNTDSTWDHRGGSSVDCFLGVTQSPPWFGHPLDVRAFLLNTVVTPGNLRGTQPEGRLRQPSPPRTQQTRPRVRRELLRLAYLFRQGQVSGLPSPQDVLSKCIPQLGSSDQLHRGFERVSARVVICRQDTPHPPSRPVFAG